MTADDRVAAALARAKRPSDFDPESYVQAHDDRAVLAAALQAERTKHALEWAEQDEELIALRAEVVRLREQLARHKPVRLREQLARHKPVWVSGPGGGYEEVVCDVCGIELTMHPYWILTEEASTRPRCTPTRTRGNPG